LGPVGEERFEGGEVTVMPSEDGKILITKDDP